MNLQKRNKAIFNCHKLGLNQTMIGQIFDLTQSTVSKVLSLIKSEKNVVTEETRGVNSKQFKVDYHENYICQIMKCINFSSQKPQQKDYRQDPEKVSQFQEKKIPEVKKSRVRK